MIDLTRRTSGILLHPTSLPGPNGIGALGAHAYRFVDFLVESGQSVWQILPLGPVGFGASPYSSFCSVAGNPLLISLSKLVEQGDLRSADLNNPAAQLNNDLVDYEAVTTWKTRLLQQAARQFLRHAAASRRQAYEEFCAQHAVWIDAYGLFMALKEHFDRKAQTEGYWGATWNTYWDKDIAQRKPRAIERWRANLAEQIEVQKVWQFYFFDQWMRLRRYANERGVTIVGDMPIFVALDSVDVWHAPQLFQLDDQRRETLVAGVPPDYFSATGQRWGNPLYNWDAMEQDHFAWWVHRFRCLLELVDTIRIDHFRGFAACWEIPAADETAENGRWVKVPGHRLFETLKAELGELPFLAEDLGVITPDVDQLRDDFSFPGMRVLQVGFENIEIGNIHLPEHHVENSVVYTGTHDNNTTLGWYRGLPETKKRAIVEFLGTDMDRPAWELLRVAMASVAHAAIVPMQDVLELDESARMNTPATVSGNWRWRLRADYDSSDLVSRLAHVTDEFDRRR